MTSDFFFLDSLVFGGGPKKEKLLNDFRGTFVHLLFFFLFMIMYVYACIRLLPCAQRWRGRFLLCPENVVHEWANMRWKGNDDTDEDIVERILSISEQNFNLFSTFLFASQWNFQFSVTHNYFISHFKHFYIFFLCCLLSDKQ